MSKEFVLPALDADVLNKKAQEFAMQGAIESLKEYYTGWKSPFREKINEQLQGLEVGSLNGLPDIIALINDGLTKEAEAIANNAVAKSFIPMMQRLLVREDKEVKFSDLLREFISATESTEYEECDVEVNESNYGWLDVRISNKDKTYTVTLHQTYKSEKEQEKKYKVLSLPDESGYRERVPQTMKISLDGVTLELPFTNAVLKDNFKSYIARLVIGGCEITMDCLDFDEEMFTKECHC